MDRPVHTVRGVIVVLGLVLASGAEGRRDAILTLSLPPDVSREAAERRDPVATARLRALTAAHLSTHQGASHDAGLGDQVVVWVDHRGVRLMPDHDAAVQKAALVAGRRTRLRFTFHSLDDPWTPEDVRALRYVLRRCHRIARILYGDPAFRITVNVSKGPTGPYAALYFPLLNEIVLTAGWQPQTVCHEMVHAFHDDYVPLLATFEEGMTRAMEVELLGRIPGYTHLSNPHHSYVHDVYHDLVNAPGLGALSGYFAEGTLQLLSVRYGLAGYAWAKPFIENEEFFRTFNREYYARMAADPTTNGDEAALVALAEGAAPIVEGQPFRAWYANQGVFETDPPRGYFLPYFPNGPANGGLVKFFRRLPSGEEVVQPGAAVTVETRDAQDGLLASGSFVTDEFGNAFVGPDVHGYFGRVTVRVEATSLDGPVQTALVLCPHTSPPFDDARGVIGIVPDRDTGTVVITPVAPPGPAVAVPLENGAFRAPALETARGQFEVSYTDGALQAARLFTKDAASYFVALPHVDPTTTTSTSTTTTLPPVPTVMIPNDKLKLQDDSFPPIRLAKRRIDFRSRGDRTAMAPPAPGSAGDPTAIGATLVVYNAAGRPDRVTLTLPATNWVAQGAGVYTYRDAQQLLGPMKKVKVKPGFVKLEAFGAGWGYRLDDPPQGIVAVRLRFGDAVEWCAVVPAKTTGNPPSSARFDRVDEFEGAVQASPPSACPPIP